MRLKSFIFFILLFALGFSGESLLSQTSTKNNMEWKSLIDSQYVIQYPEDWKLNQSGQMGTSLMLFSPKSSDEDQFRENVNLMIQDLTGLNISLDQFVTVSESQIKTMITEGNIITSDRLKENDLDFHKVLYTGKQGLYNLTFEQYYWVEKEKAYILTLTCETDQFDLFKETGERILNSFKLKIQ